MKKQALAIPASSEMQKFIFLRISQLQGRLLIIFLPMQNEEKASPETCYRGSTKLFEIILGLTFQNLLNLRTNHRKVLKPFSRNHGLKLHLLKKQFTAELC